MHLDGIDWQGAPWRDLPLEVLGPALSVPSMLSAEEARLYHWLGTRAEGTGAVIDLGAFAGGSAARLLSGLAAAGAGNRLHAYDRFTATAQLRERHLYPAGLPEQDHDDILPAVNRFLSPWADRVTLERGDIAQVRWTGGPVEILAIDAGKTPRLADRIAAEFLTALEPGRSVLIHQDFLRAEQPWLAAQMARLAGFFTPLAKVGPDCVLFLPTARVTEDALAQARTEGLDDIGLIEAVLLAQRAFDDRLPGHRFRAMVRKIRANPGVRISWQMRK